MKLKWFLAIAAGFFAVLLLNAHGVSAQEVTANLTELQQTSGLGDQSFYTIVGNIIRVVLSLLGVITLGVIIFGGFLYMTSSGNEESIDKAKKTIMNGVIGLTITLSAFGITQFVMKSLGNATGTQTGFNSNAGGDGGGNGNIDTGYAGFDGTGASLVGGLQVKSIVPTGTQTYANIKVSVVFTGIVDETTVSKNVKVTSGGVDVGGLFAVKGDTVTFVPGAACPEPNQSKKCFESGKEYVVTVTGGKGGIVSATSKKPLTCGGSSCTAKFVAGSKIDVTAPTISNADPKKNDKIPTDQIVPIKALLSDDNAVALGRVEINGVVLESVAAKNSSGAQLQEFALLSKKFSTKGDAASKNYKISIIAEDVAGNSTTLSYDVQTSPQHCFDKKINFDEVDIDCSAPGGACGLCSNIACKADIDCAGGSICDATKKVCVPVPAIKLVQPQDGAPGTFVTIGGDGFGTQFGEVTFLGDPADTKDDVVAALACATGWTGSQVVIQVPTKAVSGAIQLRNAAGASDVTDDADGLKLSKFVINDVERPGLCSVTPQSGLPGSTKITLTGNEFLGDAALERKLFIGGYLIENAVWGGAGQNTVTAVLPQFEPAKVDVQVTIKSIASNPLQVVIEALDASVPPSQVTSLSSTAGGVGQYITLKGAGFGTTPNKVYFAVVDATGKLTSDQTVADINFPQQCAKTFWSDSQIIVKVPQLSPGNYAVVVQPFGKTKQSTYKMFTVNGNKPGPQVCALVSDAGPADGNIKVTLYGDNFGKDAGAVIFNNKTVSKPVSSGSGWSNTAATVVVPAGIQSGDVKIVQAQTTLGSDVCDKNPASCSNPMTYTVLDCRVTQNSCAAGTMCCGNGSCQKDCGVEPAKPVKGVFAWCFSTGDSCDVIQPPRVVEECVTGAVPSPSPSALWPSTAQAGACGNSIISLKFSQPIDPQTVSTQSGSKSSLIVEECAGSPEEIKTCERAGEQVVALENVQIKEKIDGKNTGLFATPKNLKPLTKYRVTVTNTITAFDSGLALLGPDKALGGNECKPSGNGVYCYYFTTSEKQGKCDLDSVSVAPSTFNATSFGLIADPLSKNNDPMYWSPIAMSADKCQVLDPTGYRWSWSPSKNLDKDFDFASAAQPFSAKTSFTAKSPTAGKTPATITLTETETLKVGTGKLSIDLGVPVITEQCEINGARSPSPSSQWGGEVCAEAPIVVEFNQPVVQKNATGPDSSFVVKIWECNGKTAGKECDSVVKPEVTTGFASYKFSDERYIYAFQPTSSLAKGIHYLVEVPITTKGEGQFGKAMTQKAGCRPGVGYCFTFKTTPDATECKINSVEVSPYSWSAIDYGVQKTFNQKGDIVDKLWHAQAFGKNQCVWLKNTYKWSWYVDKDHLGFAAINPGIGQEVDGNLIAGLVGKYFGTSPDQNVAAYKETKYNEPVNIIAAAEGVEGRGYMDIAFPSPTVNSYQPSACGGSGVCSDSVPSIEFSVMMNEKSLSEHAFLFECPAAKDDKTDCAFTDANLGAAQKLSASALPPAPNAANKKLIYVLTPPQQMKLNAKYRVIINEGALSTANKKFVGFNYPNEKPKYFSWTYTVSQEQCLPKKVVINPANPMAQAQGEKQLFIASPYSAPDTCYPEGQLLDASKLYWAWGTSDSKVVQFYNATSTNKQMFLMAGKGTVDIVDKSQSAVVGASTKGATGNATWKLQCSSPPVECPADTWAGSDFCCHIPPKVSKTYPVGNETDVCRNTLVTIDVTDWVEPKSANTSTVRLGFATTDVKECVGGTIENGICFGGVPYSISVINSKTKTDAQEGRIVLNINKVLPASRKIVLQVRPFGTDDKKTVGLRSTLAVPVIGTEISFVTGTNFCELTTVKVLPEEVVFTKLSDKQNAYAYGLSKQGNALLPISSIPDVYDWGWYWYTGDAKIAKYADETMKKITEPTIIPGGFNGQTNVTALAKITKDTIIKPATVGKTVAASATVDANLCEFPWFPENYPAANETLSAQNFSFWYCQNAGKAMLPSLSAVKDNMDYYDSKNSATVNYTTLSSFRLVDPSSGGAIGFRVEKNLKQYSALEWFYQRQFKGDPQPITIDGLSGIRAGNTVYLNFGNSTGSNQFTNILVVSLTDTASPEMQNIFNQIIEGMQFARNIKDVGLCYQGTSPLNQMCARDSDCESGQTCKVPQSKFRRDTMRVIDASVMTRGIEVAKAAAQKYPIIAKDSLIPGISSSRWPSWNSLMQQLGIATVVDPINEYAGCSEASDVATCFDVKSKQYSCGAASSVYHYRTINSGVGYELGIPLEQDAALQGTWGAEWKANVAPHLQSNFCSGKPLTASAVCGDGAIGGAEQCDPPGTKVTGTDSSTYGTYTGVCSAQCMIDQKVSVNLCGDGIVQSAAKEECDDGAKYNGQYNHCGLDCKTSSALGACGNGIVEKANEVCDIGTAAGRVFMGDGYLPDGSVYFGVRCDKINNIYQPVKYNVVSKTLEYHATQKVWSDDKYLISDKIVDICGGKVVKIGICENHDSISCIVNGHCPLNSKCVFPVVGTKYSKSEINSCNWNCKAKGSYCGDKVVNSANGEQCDGDQKGDQCTKICKDDCTWESFVGNTSEPTCKPDDPAAKAAMIGCGDGKVDAESGEECDLGKACVAGKTSTDMVCKEGGQNGIECVPQYGQNNSCQFCTASCKKGYVGGGFCGDGVVNGAEECDKESFGAVCNMDQYDYLVGFKCTKSCTIEKGTGSCVSCMETTTNYSKKFPATAPVGSVIPKITLTDDTLGWLPGGSGIRVGFTRTSPISFISSPNGVDKYFFNTVYPTYGEKTISVALDSNLACLQPDRHYKIQLLNSYEDGAKSEYTDSSISLLGGAFDYVIKQHEYPSLESLSTPNKFNIMPYGMAGDYRIVLKADSILDVNLKITNGNSVSQVGLLGQSLSGNCASYKTDGKDAESSFVDERKRVSGCLDGSPFAELAYAKQIQKNNTGDVVVAGSTRYITSIRKPDSKGYPITAIYEYSIRGLSGEGSVMVYKYVDAAWKLVFDAKLTQAQISNRAMKPIKKWDVFTFVGNNSVQKGDYSVYDLGLTQTQNQNVIPKFDIGFDYID